MADSLNPQVVFLSSTILPFILDTPGAVDYSGRRYTIAEVQDPNVFGPPTTLRVYMSIDDGLTWAEQDSGNAPLCTSGISSVGFFYPKAGGNTFYMAGSQDAAGVSGACHLMRFNMDTNTWGADIGGGPTIFANDKVMLFRRSDGSSVLLYGRVATGTGQQQHWVIYNGSWGSPGTIPLPTEAIPPFNTASRNDYIGAGLTDDDRVCFLVAEHLLINIWYGSIDASDTASTLVDTGIGFGGNFQNISWGQYVPSIDTMIFPQSTYDSNGQGATSEGGVIKCTPSASPAFTYETVNITEFSDPSFDGLSVRVLLSPDAGTLRFLWLTHSLSMIANNNIFFATQAVGATSWSASTLLWNYVANPPNPTPPIDGVEPLFTVSWSSDNQLGIVLSGWVTELASNFCDIEYYLSSFVGTTPVLLTFNLHSPAPNALLNINPLGPAPGPILNPVQCIIQFDLDAAGVPIGTGPGGGSTPPPPPPPPPPPSVPVITTLTIPGGTTGFFYNFALTATNNPTSWTATGLPAGLEIGPLNGALVGLPTASGTFSIIVTAHNSSGNSLPVTFSLVIGSSGVAPTFISTSPLPPGNIGAFYSFQFTANGTNPIVFDGIVPNGIAGTSGGLITWANPVPGTYTIQMRATNAAGNTGLVHFTLVISDVPLPPTPPTPPS